MKTLAIGCAALSAVCALGVGCGDDSGAQDPDARAPDAAAPDAMPPDAMPEPDADPNRPELLSQTGLYADIAAGTLADGVLEFQPAYELWSDSAVKRRWVKLPEGTQIDTTDMDFWTYPQGTRLWKEFVRDGTRVETRLLYKTGPGVGSQSWYMVAYVWNPEQTEAVAAPDGLPDAMGTEHDVPGNRDCRKCHARMLDVALGFSALLLDHELPGLSLDDLVQQGALTVPPAGAGPTYFTIPGDDTERAALGYIHSNCGNCHNLHSDVQDAVSLRMRLSVGQLGSVEETDTYAMSVGVPPEVTNLGPLVTSIIEPGDPAASAVHVRMDLRDGGEKQMPPLGSELVDPDGLAIVDAWILSLPAMP